MQNLAIQYNIPGISYDPQTQQAAWAPSLAISKPLIYY